MVNELNENGLAAIQELMEFIEESGFELDDSITFDNDQRSIVRVFNNGEFISESYFPIEVFGFLKNNGYLKAA